MRDKDFFRRAFDDPSFRREMLAEYRYRAQVDRVIGIAGLVGLLCSTAYWMWRGQDWTNLAFGSGAVIILSLGSAMHTSARVAALETIDERASNSKP